MFGDDDYQLSNVCIQKQKKKSKSNAVDVDEEVQRRTEQVEEKNAELIRMSRQAVQRCTITQRRTTGELLMQGERLNRISSNAEEVYNLAKEGEGIMKKIKKEKKLIPIPGPIEMIKKVFGINSRKGARRSAGESGPRSLSKMGELEFEKDSERMEDNMKLLLNDIRRMNREQKLQNMEVKRQNVQINHIRDVTKKGGEVMSRMEKRMKEM